MVIAETSVLGPNRSLRRGRSGLVAYQRRSQSLSVTDGPSIYWPTADLASDQLSPTRLMDDDKNIPALESVTDSEDLPAGEFSAWLHQTRSAQVAKGSANVECGTCVGCCTSSYFMHIGPDESQTLKRIPKQLLFPAPGLPKGHVLMGYDEKGRCPMLVDGKCSIYEHRPQTCRSYDCRVFPAAGIRAGDADKEPINQRISRWKFSYPTERARVEHSAVQAAAQFLRAC